MSWTTQNPLSIIPGGDDKQSGFTKVKNEFISLYSKLSTFISETSGHSHDGTTDNGTPIKMSNIVQDAGYTVSGATHQPNPFSITSSSGVLTLTEDSNSFIANGSEAITSITGWTKGLAEIRWNTARVLTYNSTSLILQNSANRITAIGDVGIYEMTSAGAREVNYFPAITNSNPTGSLINVLSKITPAGYLKANGAAISRSAYSNLMNNSFCTINTTGNTTSGSASIVNFTSTTDMAIGMKIEGTGIPAGATISAINSATSITISSNATATNTGTTITVFPYGNGDGSTTYNLPDLRGEHLRAFDDGRNADTTGFTLATTSGSNVISSIPNTGFMFVGMGVSGTGIPGGATVASITSATAITLSANATATGTVLITFTGRRFGSWESDDYKTHNHPARSTSTSGANGVGESFAQNTAGTTVYTNGNGSPTYPMIGSTGGSETRGRNYAVPIYIKY